MYMAGKEKLAVFKLLRTALKKGQLQARQTYYDYYDSCHPPIETPDAQWVEANQLLKEDDLWKTKSNYSVKYISENTFMLFTGYKTLEVKIGQ